MHGPYSNNKHRTATQIGHFKNGGFIIATAKNQAWWSDNLQSMFENHNLMKCNYLDRDQLCKHASLTFDPSFETGISANNFTMVDPTNPILNWNGANQVSTGPQAQYATDKFRAKLVPFLCEDLDLKDKEIVSLKKENHDLLVKKEDYKRRALVCYFY